MIRYALSCEAGHRFESWFGDSASFDSLAGRGLVSCPSCGTTLVSKAIMAPAVARSGAPAPAAPDRAGRSDTAPEPTSQPIGEKQRALRAMVREMRSRVLAQTQDVGDRFPTEVRRMHDGVIPHRDIRGEATMAETRSLLEDGILVLPVPGAPDELN